MGGKVFFFFSLSLISKKRNLSCYFYVVFPIKRRKEGGKVNATCFQKSMYMIEYQHEVLLILGPNSDLDVNLIFTS